MARLFDNGSSQYLSNSNAVRNAYPLSISAWFNSDDDTITQGLVALADNNSSRRVTLNITNGNNVYVSDVGSSARTATTSTTWTANTWHHAGGVFVSTTERSVFLDGGGKDTTTISSGQTWGMDTTYIGVNENGATVTLYQYMSGSIAEVGIWNVELTDAEIAILALGYSPLLIRPQSLVAYWPLIGRTSPEIDIVGGYDMTLNNGPTTAAHPPILYHDGLYTIPESVPAGPPPIALYRRRIFVVGG